MRSVPEMEDPIDAEAAAWLAAIECGTADPEAFGAWRARDPAHALAFIRVSQVSADLAALRESGLGSRLEPSNDRLAPAPKPAADRRRLLKLGTGALLGGALVAGLGGLGWSLSAAAQDVETAVGEQRRIVIADGVALELNTRSHVRWRRSGPGYDIELLGGEVMLERQPGSAPCRLRCKESLVDLAPGGRMVARSSAQGVDLVMLDGEASLHTPASQSSVRVATLNKASVIAGKAPSLSAISQFEAGAVAAWQQGQLQFNGESLENAVAEYNRYLSRPIEIDDPSIRQIRLGGRFPATDPADFCRALSQIYGVSAQFEAHRIRLMRS